MTQDAVGGRVFRQQALKEWAYVGVVGELATGYGVVQMDAFAGMELATGSAKESPFLSAWAVKRGASGKEGGAGGFPIDGHAAKAGT